MGVGRLDARRHRLVVRPFPRAWEDVLETRVAAYRLLNTRERHDLRCLVQIFVAEKTWEGCGGLELDETIEVVIAAQACILVLGLGIDAYARVETILVYPSAVLPRRSRLSFFGSSHAVSRQPRPIVGQAINNGQVVFAWDRVESDARDHGSGQNVVYHEFAHQLDMIDGVSDGVPPLAEEVRGRFAEVFERARATLVEQCERDEWTFLDPYGAKSAAELFAVATEHFFEEPEGLQQHHPEMYWLLTEFYRQDPMVRELRAAGRPWRERARRFRPKRPERITVSSRLRAVARGFAAFLEVCRAGSWILLMVALVAACMRWCPPMYRGRLVREPGDQVERVPMHRPWPY